MSEYQSTADPDTIYRVADGAWIPNDERNPDWQTYQAWFAAGNEPDPAPDTPVAAQSLTVDDLAAILVKKLILSQSDISKK